MTTPLDLDAMRARDRAFGDGESEDAGAIAQDRHALLAHCAALDAALAAATAPTRGSLINALASAGAARVGAESAFERARADAARSTKGRQCEAYYDADQRLREAKEAEAAARAALDAWERADREADPCPGSRGF